MVNELESSLEAALRLAAEDPAHRPQFYMLLLESTVYILGHSDGTTDGARTLETGEEFSIQYWVRKDGSPVIPFFTSLTALKRAIENEVRFIALPARALFEMTKGSFLILNPKSSYGKEFFPNEIEVLLSEGVNFIPERRIASNATQVLLEQPTDIPSKMVDSLTVFFSKHKNVKAAYLTLIHDPSHDDKPNLLVGIEIEGKIKEVINEASVVVRDSAIKGEPVDLMVVERGDHDLSDYIIRHVKPFYERRWGCKLKSFLGIGRA